MDWNNTQEKDIKEKKRAVCVILLFAMVLCDCVISNLDFGNFVRLNCD